MIEFNIEENKKHLGASIKVMGVGGGGGNAVNSMVDSDLIGVEFISANTDAQSLNLSKAESKIQIGEKITKGLGAGSDPDVGRRAAEEDIDLVMEHVSDADILFLTAGMGGGTGTGATAIIARAAKELGILTVAVVTKPFEFEGRKRMKQAEIAIEDLRKEVDTFIVIPNQKLLEVAEPNIPMLDAFAMVNEVLMRAIKGVADIIVKPGHINVDFADVRSIMKGMGKAIMGTGRCIGEDRARQAAIAAINSPLLENINIEGAKGVLINISGSQSLTLQEINDAANLIYERASDDAEIILGSVIDQELGDEVMVTVIATGFEDQDAASSEVSLEYFKKNVKENAYSLNAKTGNVDYSQPVEKERYTKIQQEEKVEFSKVLGTDEPINLDDIDTPTFMRRAQRRKGSDL
jgi:cell division protein FtsZ